MDMVYAERSEIISELEFVSVSQPGLDTIPETDGEHVLR
jgi:hypothetical protein